MSSTTSQTPLAPSGAPVLDQTWEMIGVHRGTGLFQSGHQEWIGNLAVDIWAIQQDLSSTKRSRKAFPLSRLQAARDAAAAPSDTKTCQ